MASDLIAVPCLLTRAQQQGLKALSAESRTPVTVLIRQAVTALIAQQAKKSKLS